MFDLEFFLCEKVMLIYFAYIAVKTMCLSCVIKFFESYFEKVDFESILFACNIREMLMITIPLICACCLSNMILHSFVWKK